MEWWQTKERFLVKTLRTVYNLHRTVDQSADVTKNSGRHAIFEIGKQVPKEFPSKYNLMREMLNCWDHITELTLDTR